MAIINGTDNDDVLRALASLDIVNGLAGDDDLSSAFHETTLNGGSGNDVLSLQPLQDTNEAPFFCVLNGGD